MKHETLQSLAVPAVGLVLLLALELPVLAYPAAPDADLPSTPSGVSHRLPASTLDHGVPALAPIAVRTAAAATAKAEDTDESRWVPTKSEGIAFTVIGASMMSGGTAMFIIGMARLMPIVAEFGGLVTAAVGPLVLAGVGLTLLFVGIPFFIHGLKALKALRESEQPAITAIDGFTTPTRVVLLRF